MLTIEKYEKMPDWIFAKWEIQNNAENWVYLTDNDYWRLLKRVATKNQYDRRMYFMRADEFTYEQVKTNWDSISSFEDVKRILNCDDEVMKKLSR